MKYRAILPGILVLAAACGNANEAPGAASSAEEHAAHTGAGAVDVGGPSMVHLTPQQERALGVVYTAVTRDTLVRTIRTVGHIQAPEPNIVDVTPKIDGFVEELLVDFTGESVRIGDPLLTLYSPALVAAQEELLTARRLVARLDSSTGTPWLDAQSLLVATRHRLAYWDVTPEQIEALERTGEVRRTLTLVAPVTGIVLEKHIVSGQRVTPGMPLYRIADLREMWVEGEVFEQDLQFVRVGAQVHIEVAAYPGTHLMGSVSFVYPTVDERGRTTRMRVTVPNRDLRLKPGMFATVYFDAIVGETALSVPIDAVVVTGERNLVFVRDAEGMLTPREVVVGATVRGRVEILSGLTEGETVVASANFLVDAESRLAGSAGSMPGMEHGAGAPSPTVGGQHHD